MQVPEFVEGMMKSKIPFGKNTKLARSFNYEEEVKNKKSLKSLPESLMKTLYEFQREGIEFGLSKFGRCLIGDEMGVGKTV